MIAFRRARPEYGLVSSFISIATALRRGISPVSQGSELHTDVMKDAKPCAKRFGCPPLRTVAIGGARRDEERSRAKERVFSVRSHADHRGTSKRTSANQPWRSLSIPASGAGGEDLRVLRRMFHN